MRLLVAVVAALFACSASARNHRDHHAREAFKRANPCPANGHMSGKCPGFTIDHRVALCVGGPDTPANMRWMEHGAALLKDKWECRPGWQANLVQCEQSGCFVK
jgi:hypothetical protein